MRQHDVRRLVNKLAILADALRGHQVEGDAQVHATLAKVSVHRGLVLIPLEENVEFAKIAAELLRRYGGILPTLPSMLFPGNKNRSAQCGFAYMPDPFCLGIGI